MSRRAMLAGSAALTASLFTPKGLLAADFPTAEVNKTGLAVTDDTVTIGILHSITGTMAISETGSVQAEKLAIEQINAQGGILGRKIEYIQEDGASDWPTFAEKARKLLVNDKVASVMGCWTSASRKAVLPVFEPALIVVTPRPSTASLKDGDSLVESESSRFSSKSL